jgi:MoCo/4Fe-4S cofactor protein with predicted Tat translocation signal
MRRYWKNLAERAATPAFTTEQVAEAFPVALKNEFREAPLAQIRDILGGSA